MMTDPTQITRQLLDFQKLTFSGLSEAATLLQNQAASAVNRTLDHSKWIPLEGRQAVLSWLDVCQEGHAQFNTFMQDSFSSIEKFIVAEDRKPIKAKAQETTPVSAKKTTSAKSTK